MLPALCGCGHGMSILDVDYTRHCCVNCSLFRNRKLHEQLLKTLLQSYRLV